MLPDDEIERLLRASRANSFAPGFGARVLRRARMRQVSSLSETIRHWFIWMVPATIAAIAVLAIHNARTSSAGNHGIDAILALQPVTLDAAYAFDTGSSAP